MAGETYRFISKKVKEVRNYSFNLYAYSLLHVDTSVLKILVNKMGKHNSLGFVI